MKKRICLMRRKTKETDITLRLNIDGRGNSDICTGIGLLDHMLELFSFHGLFDIQLKVKSDIERVDIHHANEDIGIVLGEAFKKSLGDKRGINRFGFFKVMMEESMAEVVLDISGRGYFRLELDNESAYSLTVKNYSLKEAEHLLDAFAKHLGMNLYIKITTAQNKDLHSIMEPVFKALALALSQAIQIHPRRKGVPSTKGIID